LSQSNPKLAQLFSTCLVNEFYPDVAFSVAKILEKLGWQLEVPMDQVCCGQPAFNAGYMADARKVALRFLDIFHPSEGPIIVPSGSCSDMLAHHLPTMFEGDASNHERALRVAGRVREFSQFVVDDLATVELGGRLQASVAYHASCHLSRGLGVKEQPLKLIRAVQGARVLGFANSEECCGFGGTFSVTYDQISGAMLDEKMKHLSAARPDRIVSCDMGCLMHIEGGYRHKGEEPRVQHLAQFLAESLA